MSNRGVDEEKGTVNVYEACPNKGDSVVIINCGDHFEVRHEALVEQVLTEEEVARINQGHITWH